jgi:catecholate siderophore receptor
MTYLLPQQWRVGAGINYRGSQNPEGQRIYLASAFATADVMAEHTLNDTTTVKFNITNLTDKLYIDQLYRGFYVPGTGRRIELSMKKLF